MQYIDLFVLVLIAWIESYILSLYYLRLRRIEPSYYYSLSDLFLQKVKGWLSIRYFIFRLLPIWLILAFNLKLFSEISGYTIFACTLINYVLVIHHLFRTNFRLLTRKSTFLVWVVNMSVSLLILWSPVLIMLIYGEITRFLPSGQWLVDNIWSSILTLFFASFLLQSWEDFQLDKEFLLKSVDKYRDVILSASKKYKADADLIMAIAIYENMQRPKWIRMFEWLIVSIFRKSLSQGIMQVKSSSLISDVESIYLWTEKFLNKTDKLEYHELRSVLLRYNGSEEYADWVLNIYYEIHH